MSKMENDSDDKNSRKKKLKTDDILPVLICSLAIPLSMSMWIMNLIYARISSTDGHDEAVVIHPTRWLIACIISFTTIVYGLRKKSLSFSGGIFGFVIGLFLTIGSYTFTAALLTFFFTSSKATKFRARLKEKFEEDFKDGGQRNWVQVLCNGGMALQLSLLYLLDVGSSERPIDFIKDYRASWLSIGVLGAISCCNGDTWASEFGTVLTSSKPFLITKFKRVPCGTNGGVTFIGTLMSILGGAVIGMSHYLVILYFVDERVLLTSPPQWPVVLIGALGGFIGSFVDSVLGATVQFSGVDKQGRIVSQPSLAVKHVSGRMLLDNHSVNLISSVFTGLMLPTVANLIWP